MTATLQEAGDPARRTTTHPVAPRSDVVVEITGDPLTVDDVVAVARHGAQVRLTDRALAGMAASRAVVESLADDDRPHYGVSTGFGALARRHIPTDKRAQLQLGLVRSHAAGSGPEVEREVVRALQLLRLATLATGRTGARPEVAETYAAMLNAQVTPVVHEYGSLGCSGDLAPLAHVALAALGEGPVRVGAGPDGDGELLDAAEALASAGIAPLELREKEGLALINGTDGMLGMLCLAIHDLRDLLRTADVAAAASVEALLGSDAPFAADLVGMRPHPGQAASAANLRALLAGSPVVASHRTLDADGRPECTRVQDAYSLRCAPQVHGAARDTVDHAATVAGRELASAIDNPVVTVDGRVESNGNFHGAPVAYVLDFLAVAVADVASMSERRTDRFLDVARNEGLPAFLADDPGVDSGLMIAQYTAAGIVSELKRLAAPASVDSVPSSAMQEDHVSMGWAGARKLRRALDGLGRVLAVELMTAARALDLRLPDLSEPGAAPPARGSDKSQRPELSEPGAALPAPGSDSSATAGAAAGTGAVHALLRTVVAGPGPDRFLAPEIEAVTRLVVDGEVVAAASAAVGPLA
ncbi:histidine ammonia-lyase [Isoptericola sp. NPDC055881]